jgi:hypothetical protein
MIKFFLHISKQEQRHRFEKISKDPLTAWHVSAEDWEHHRRYDDWLVAYEEAFERTESEWGPWTIVEATDRRYTWVKIYQTILVALEEKLNLPHPPLPKASQQEPAEEAPSQASEEEAFVATEDLILEEAGPDSAANPQALGRS